MKLKRNIIGLSLVLQHQAVEFSKDLTYKEPSVEIVNCQVCQLCVKGVTVVKVLWNNLIVRECIWETRAMMRVVYLNLFQFWFVPPSVIKFEDEFFYKEGRL